MGKINLKHLIALLLIAILLLAACTSSEPEGPKKVAIINGIGQVGVATVENFKSRMTELGYGDGETIVYTTHTFNPDETEALAEAAQAAAAQPVNLIVTMGVPATDAARQAVAEQDIPILFQLNDPVGQGFVTNLRQPGGNMTGVTAGAAAADSEGRRLEWLKRIKPDIDQVYIIHNPDDASIVRSLAVVQASAEDLGIELIVDSPSGQAEVDTLIANFPKDVEVFFILADRRLVSHVPELIKLSLERQFIFSTPVLDITRAGGLMAFAADFGDIGKQMARQADLILKGADPGQMPIEAPEILLNINLKTAEALGLEVPEDVLEAAYEIIRE